MNTSNEIGRFGHLANVLILSTGPQSLYDTFTHWESHWIMLRHPTTVLWEFCHFSFFEHPEPLGSITRVCLQTASAYCGRLKNDCRLICPSSLYSLTQHEAYSWWHGADKARRQHPARQTLPSSRCCPDFKSFVLCFLKLFTKQT